MSVKWRGVALIVASTLVGAGTFLPWITISWLSGGASTYNAFQSEVLASGPGFTVLAVAALVFAVGLCDLGLIRLGMRSWHAFACSSCLVMVVLLTLLAPEFESTDAGGSGQGVASVSVAQGSWVAMAGVVLGLCAFLTRAVLVKRSGHRSIELDGNTLKDSVR